MAETVTHPLLGLPDGEIIQKLREMSLEEVFKFSLISEKCKDLVSSIKINVSFMSVIIGNDICITFGVGSKHMDFTYYIESDMYWGTGAYGRKKKLTAPQSVRIRVMDPRYMENLSSSLANSDLSMKNWLEHLQDIFNCHAIDSIRFNESSTDFDIDEIREVLGNKSKFDMQFLRSDAYKQLILEKFMPVEKLSIEKSSFQDSKIPSSILIQSFDYLSIEEGIRDEVITLDELLMTNSKAISLKRIRVSPKDLNKFIRLWQQGSNPHMECINIFFPTAEGDDDETIMRGIKHEVAPANRNKRFKSVGFKNPVFVYGGMDIHRNDGVKATIQYGQHLPNTYWDMYVWFDHCAVES